MKMEKLCMLALLITIIGFNVLAVSAASQDQIGNIANQTQDKLNNASQMANQTAQDVNNTLGPIQSILNAINNILQQIQQILSFFGGQ